MRPSEIRKAFDRAAKLKDPIDLSIGKPHYPTPEPIVSAIVKALRDGATGYTQTQGILPLRERMARKYEEVNGFSVEPDQVLISAGVASLLELLFLATIDPGDEVLLIDPYFLVYKNLLDFFNARIHMVPENFTDEDLERCSSRDLKLILYSSPSNPSGHVMSEEQVRKLSQLATKTGATLASDEIYELFDYDGHFVSSRTIHPDALVLSGFSKTYSMTGLRLSAAAGPRELIEKMVTLQQNTVVCAPAPVQWAGLAALDLDMTPHRETYRKHRDLCLERLTGRVKFTRPQGAFYVFCEIGGEDMAFIERAMEEKRLLLVPGRIFSSSQRHVRLSYAVPEETLDRGLSAFLDLL